MRFEGKIPPVQIRVAIKNLFIQFIETSKQASKQANMQASKHASKQASKHTNTTGNTHIMHTHKHTHTGTHRYKQTSKQAIKQKRPTIITSKHKYRSKILSNFRFTIFFLPTIIILSKQQQPIEQNCNQTQINTLKEEPSLR